jgi:hypothetical protein
MQVTYESDGNNEWADIVACSCLGSDLSGVPDTFYARLKWHECLTLALEPRNG